MAYRVEFRPRAENDLDNLFFTIWFSGPPFVAPNGLAVSKIQYTLWGRCLNGVLSLADSQGLQWMSASFFTGAFLTSIRFTLQSNSRRFGFFISATLRAGHRNGGTFSSDENRLNVPPAMIRGLGGDFAV